MKGEVKKFYEENLNKLGTFDPTQPPPEGAADTSAAPAAPVRVTTQAQYDALPSGANYIDSLGNAGVKP